MNIATYVSIYLVLIDHIIKFFFLDIDECLTETDDCDVGATCTNTIGSFNCGCSVGYTGDGVTCTGKFMNMPRCFNFFYFYSKRYYNIFGLDIDECLYGLHNCDHLSSCSNTIGSFSCGCPLGMAANGGLCAGKL